MNLKCFLSLIVLYGLAAFALWHEANGEVSIPAFLFTLAIIFGFSFGVLWLTAWFAKTIFQANGITPADLEWLEHEAEKRGQQK